MFLILIWFILFFFLYVSLFISSSNGCRRRKISWSMVWSKHHRTSVKVCIKVLQTHNRTVSVSFGIILHIIVVVIKRRNFDVCTICFMFYYENLQQTNKFTNLHNCLKVYNTIYNNSIVAIKYSGYFIII